MVCPHCGVEAPAPGGRCVSCNEIGATSATSPGVAAVLPQVPEAAWSSPTGGSALRGILPPLPQGPLTAGQQFGSRYRILKPLGSGGMGVVYQAWDEELGVAVALKVIRPEVLSDPLAARDVERRFKRELLLARQVTHKHVVRIHDLGEVDGIKYLTMPYVEGRDLASVMRQTGRLPVGRTLRLARQIAAGLQAAHEAGVVHRDLKPENVMLDADDNALIMDFGISRSVGGGRTMTVHGEILGTLEYMAPEQAKGHQFDGRADVYAFGLMVRDMLAGRNRVAGSENAMAELMARMTQRQPSLRAQVPEVPEALEAVVARCIAPEPADRYGDAAELLAALSALDDEGRLSAAPASAPRLRWSRRLGAAAAVALICGAAAALSLGWRSAGSGPAARQPIPVLIADFENQTGDPVFEGSLEQALGIAVEGAGFISTYPRTEARRTLASLNAEAPFDETGARIVAMREGIPVILAGTIAPARDGYTVSITAVEPRTDGDRVIVQRSARAGSKADVLQAVGTLAAAIRTSLGDTARVEAGAPETFTAASLDAMRAYVRGQELNAAGKPQEALKEFERAIAFDPEFGRAYVNMASIYTNLKMDAEAKQYYERAIQHLDRMTDREKYRTRGVYYLGIERDYEQAVSSFRRLVDEYPADNMGYANLALAYLHLRDIQRAVEVGRKAVEVYPNNVLQRTNFATYSMYAGDFDGAIREADRALAASPAYEFAHLTKALSLLARGDEGEARAAYAALAGVSPLGRSLAALGEADLEMYAGRYARAAAVLQEGIAADGQGGGTTGLALKYVALAEAHEAMGRSGPAGEAARRAVALESHESVQFPAARVLIATGHGPQVQRIAASMEKALQRPMRSYGRLLRAAVALREGKHAEALDGVQEALRLHDSWAGHALLGEVYTATGQHVQALEQWDLCLARRGEATDVFFADTSTLRYLPPVYYWRARALDAAGSSGARAAYEAFLRLRSRPDIDDGRAADARQRLSLLSH